MKIKNFILTAGLALGLGVSAFAVTNFESKKAVELKAEDYETTIYCSISSSANCVTMGTYVRLDGSDVSKSFSGDMTLVESNVNGRDVLELVIDIYQNTLT